MQASVYIILLNYNNHGYTIECIRSLLKISYKNYKLIVVDNGSDEASIDALDEWIGEPVILIKSDINKGFTGGNNIGIKYALEHEADYVLLLNNDTIVDRFFLNSLVDTAQRYNSDAVITSKIYYACEPLKIWYAGGYFNEITSRCGHVGIDETDTGQFDKEKEVTFISGCCMCIPRKLLIQVGLLDEGYFIYCEDLDFCCRVRKSGCRLIYDPKAKIYHKVSATFGKSSFLTVYYTVRNKKYIIEKYITKKYRYLAKLYDWLETEKRIVTGQYKKEAVKRGVEDHKNNITGMIVDD